MSVKIRAIFICSLLMLLSSTICVEVTIIDCLGFDFYCTTENTYLPCFYDEERNVTETWTDRSDACPDGTFCDTLNDKPCDAGIDCGGKEFFCPTASSFMRCDLKPDGNFRTSSSEVLFCTGGTYCDNIDGTAACDAIEAPTESTEAPTESTEAPTESTEAPTESTEAPTESTEAPTESTEAPTESTEAPTESTEAPTESTEAPTESTKATTEPAAPPPPLGPLPGYTCAGAGLYPHPTNCRLYIFCFVSGSTYQNSQRQCPNDLVWQPDSSKCSLNTTPCDNMDFKCVTTGRFADPLDPSKYVWCLKVNGFYLALKYSCPVGKIYDGGNACVEPIVISAIETLAVDEKLNLFSTSRRSLSVQNNDEADDEVYEESGEMIADRISLNSNEDASVYSRGGRYSRL